MVGVQRSIFIFCSLPQVPLRLRKEGSAIHARRRCPRECDTGKQLPAAGGGLIALYPACGSSSAGSLPTRQDKAESASVLNRRLCARVLCGGPGSRAAPGAPSPPPPPQPPPGNRTRHRRQGAPAGCGADRGAGGACVGRCPARSQLPQKGRFPPVRSHHGAGVPGERSSRSFTGLR